MLRCVALVRTDVSEEHNVIPIPPILFILMLEAILYSETSVLTRAMRCNITEDVILHN
jgi:hypothetical protein